MQIKVAGHSGFCFGVKRAITIAEKTLKTSKGRTIYSLGPIIHNPQVVDALLKKGLCVINNITAIKKGAIIISSHGAPKTLIQKIENKKLTLIDATCPFVKHAHDIVKSLKRTGYRVVIIGDRFHPEVKALLSLAGKDARADICAHPKKIGIISQTTQTKDNYIKNLNGLLKEDFDEIRIFNTICNDASNRQISARKILKECDIMLIVGGRNSANTKRLYQICKESVVDSYHIEIDSELKKDYFIGKKYVGVVSGASTPDSIVRKVVKKIETLVNDHF